MTNDWVQHIGDDQLVYGMPKRMVGVSTQESLAKFKKAEAEYERSNQANKFDSKGDYYWTVHPKPKACEKCQAMGGKEYMEEPERPHPNCKCEIKKHPLRRPVRYINGYLTGHAWHRFTGGKRVEISFQGVSGFGAAGVHLYSNYGHSEQVSCPPHTSNQTSFVVEQSAPILWKITLKDVGNNTGINYTITYEDWDD